MKLLNLSLKNYGSYGPNEIVFNFNEYNGINLISGPNGIGKSQLMNSIIYTLYGKTLQEKVGDVVNRVIGKNCKTAVEFQIRDDIFKCFRYRNHDQHKNNVYVFKNDKDISLKNVEDTNQLILDIVKIPYEGFINSTFFSSEIYQPFLKSRNSERLKIFERLLTLDTVNLLYDASRKHNVQLNEQINEITNSKSIIENEIGAFENSIIEYKQNAKNKLLSLKQEKDQLEEDIFNCQEKLDSWTHVDTDKEKEKYKQFSNKEILQNNIKNLHKELKVIEEPTQQLRKLAGLFIEIDWEDELKKGQKKKEIESLIDENNKKLHDLNNQIGNFNKDIYNSQKAEEEIIKKIKSFQKELVDIKAEICPRCHQHISNSKNEEIKLINDISVLEKELEEQEVETNNFNIELKKIKEQLQKLNNDNNEAEKDIIKLNILFDDAEKQKNESEKAFEKINAYNNEKKLVDEFNEKINKEICELQIKIDAIEDCNYTEEQLNNIENEIKNLSNAIKINQDRLKEINGSVNSVYDKSYIASIENKINDKHNNLQEVIKKLEDLKDDNMYYSFICDCFSNKANSFKKYYIGEMIDLFNNKINQFLPFFFSENISITFDKELNETILNGKDEITFASLSTGQKQRCELAISFALFNTARVFFSNDSNILILDEVLDQGLDFNGIRSAITILEGLEKDNKIFIVSHNPNIQELVENVIKIKQIEGFSVIS